jgi:hypothetical protein
MKTKLTHLPECPRKLTARQMLVYTGPCPACLKAAERYRERSRNASTHSKTKFTCPVCGLNAWAKPDAALICGNCFEDEPADPQTMTAR